MRSLSIFIILLSCLMDASAQEIQLSDFRYNQNLMTDISMRQVNFQNSFSGNGAFNSISAKPGYGFLASALIPGLGQAANDQLWKTAVFAVIEAGAIYVAVDQHKRGVRGERRYIAYGDEYWSVVKYAGWVHNFYHNVPGARSPNSPDVDIRSLLSPAGQAIYDQTGMFPQPAFQTSVDWAMINLDALRQLERSTLYLSSGRPFSHDVQDFGSQQYYELMSKYFQFGPGWVDWDDNIHDIHAGRDGMPYHWTRHGIIEERFNDQFRLSGNMVTLLIMNHIVSAFDAYFVIKLRQHRLSGGMEFTQNGTQMNFRYSF